MQDEPKEQITEEAPNAEAIRKIAEGFNCDYETAKEIFEIADVVLCYE